MSKKEKLIEHIRNNSKNVRFENLKKILENIGYVAINNRGSHYVFRKENEDDLTIPYKKPYVKIIYVKHVINILDENI